MGVLRRGICDSCDGENRYRRDKLLCHVILRLRLKGVERMGRMWYECELHGQDLYDVEYFERNSWGFMVEAVT